MANDRTCLVLLHAFPVSSVMYGEVADALSEGVDLVLPEFRGFGGTEPPDASPSLDVYADDVAAVLDRLGVERAVVGGCSMGGYVTMAFCRRHPERVAGLLLVDTKAGSDNEAAADGRERLAATVLADDSVGVLLGDVFASLLGETTLAERPAVVELVRSWVAAARPEAVAWAQRAMARRPDSLETLSRMDVPALVVLGDEDRIASLADADAMVQALPQGALSLLPSSGHLSAIETPDAFSETVLAWLGEAGLIDG